MKLINWIHFTWDLTDLPRSEGVLPEHYEIAPATAEDEKELRRVITSSFSLDPDWNPTMHEVMQTIDGWLAGAWESDTKPRSCCGMDFASSVLLSCPSSPRAIITSRPAPAS